jgi:hypothetical protein
VRGLVSLCLSNSTMPCSYSSVLSMNSLDTLMLCCFVVGGVCQFPSLQTLVRRNPSVVRFSEHHSLILRTTKDERKNVASAFFFRTSFVMANNIICKSFKQMITKTFFGNQGASRVVFSDCPYPYAHGECMGSGGGLSQPTPTQRPM